MKTHRITIPVEADEAHAYASASEEVRSDINSAIRQRLRSAIRETRASKQSQVEHRLAALAASGELIRAAKVKKGWPSRDSHWRPGKRHPGEPGLPAGRAQSILDEIRSDREPDLR